MILMLGLVAVSGANTEEAFTLDVDDDGIATARRHDSDYQRSDWYIHWPRIQQY